MLPWESGFEIKIYLLTHKPKRNWESLYGLIVDMLNCDIAVS